VCRFANSNCTIAVHVRSDYLLVGLVAIFFKYIFVRYFSAELAVMTDSLAGIAEAIRSPGSSRSRQTESNFQLTITGQCAHRAIQKSL
jgi:hypothetical protein